MYSISSKNLNRSLLYYDCQWRWLFLYSKLLNVSSCQTNFFRRTHMVTIRFNFKVGQNTGLTMNRVVNLRNPGCLYEGIVMHEFLHTLGKLEH